MAVERWHLPVLINTSQPRMTRLQSAAYLSEHGDTGDSDDDLSCANFQCAPSFNDMSSHITKKTTDNTSSQLENNSCHSSGSDSLNVRELEKLKSFLQQRKSVVQSLAHVIEATNSGSHHHLALNVKSMNFSITAVSKPNEYAASSLSKILALPPRI